MSIKWAAQGTGHGPELPEFREHLNDGWCHVEPGVGLHYHCGSLLTQDIL